MHCRSSFSKISNTFTMKAHIGSLAVSFGRFRSNSN